MDFSIVHHPLFIKTCFFILPWVLLNSNLHITFLFLFIGCIILSCRLRNSCQNHPLCCGHVLTQSSVQIHNEKLTKICIWLTPRNWVVWDWQTFSACVQAVHKVSFYEFLSCFGWILIMELSSQKRLTFKKTLLLKVS